MMNRRPRLTILTQDFFPNRGGLQEYLFEVAQRLGESMDVSILTPVAGPLPPGPRFQRVVASSLNPIHLWRHLRHLSPDVLLLGHARLRMFLAGRLWGSYATVTYGNDFIAAQKRWHGACHDWDRRGGSASVDGQPPRQPPPDAVLRLRPGLGPRTKLVAPGCR